MTTVLLDSVHAVSDSAFVGIYAVFVCLVCAGLYIAFRPDC
jgi:hypothetical protein